MIHPSLLLPLLFTLLAAAESNAVPPTSLDQVKVSLRPSLAIVMGIFAVMVVLTFLLLLYAKFCNVAASELFGQRLPFHDNTTIPLAAPHRASGVDKTVIESLPFFKFSTLKGAREGLECAVCLSRFEATEILRLLPKCKHAFHIECVDRWLEDHSSCPLCRHTVDGDDSLSSRSLFGEVDVGELDLFIEREPSVRQGSSARFTIGGSFRRTIDKKKTETAHKFKHRIIISDVIFNSRWSDVNSADLMSLSSDMLSVVSSKRFLKSTMDHADLWIKEEMEKKRLLESKVCESSRSLDVGSGSEYGGRGGALRSTSNNRCMSEITNVSRFKVSRDTTAGMSGGGEGVRVAWLEIARRTVQWFAGREKRLQSQNHREDTIV